MTFNFDTSWMRYYTGIQSIKDSLDFGKELIMHLSFDIKLKLKNIGSTPCRIVAWIITDSLSYKPLVNASHIIEYDFRRMRLATDYYKIVQLEQEDTTHIDFADYKLQNYKGDEFFLHAMVIFINDVDVLFYSYFIIHFTNMNFALYLREDLIRQLQQYQYIKAVMNIPSSRATDYSQFTKHFSYDEAKRLFKYFEKFDANVKRKKQSWDEFKNKSTK